ncbi:hypothetical protein BD410DRAFT_790300 [Rickenella mellea]|uniref:HNH nuclease domain-containing protein n=1 Tax=Rickenella mellea TaxID=50990 RepID=A0A4Y7Q141_9AGAM|nr:hypothetical protein BD410DRAFT_790300 [Rickenella mellea]
MYTPAHSLSIRSSQQSRNVFVWCTVSHKIAIGCSRSPLKVSTMYRWIHIAYRTFYPGRATTAFTLFPVVVEPSGPITYAVQQNGPPLPRQSQEMVLPGDYGIYNTDGSTPNFYYRFTRRLSLSKLQRGMERASAALAAKTVLTPVLHDKALQRDGRCVLTGSIDYDALTTTWILPPSLGYLLSDEQFLQNRYQRSPESCDMSHLIAPTNVLSIHKSVAVLFRRNAIGVDVDDDYRIVVFHEPKKSGCPPINSNLTLFDGPDRPSDQFLRVHFAYCLAAHAFGGDLTEDFKDGEVENFMLAFDKMSPDDPLRQSFLGKRVEQFYVRQTLKTYVIFFMHRYNML